MESEGGTTDDHSHESEFSQSNSQNMNRIHRILVSVSAVFVFSVFSFPPIAKATPGSKPAGNEQPATLQQSAQVAGRLTLFEQDAKNANLAITARIRAGFSGKTLSLSARNVKIITTRGKVVLQGTVNTAAEKRLIGDIAIRVQRRENVDNQLVVRPSPLAPTALRVLE